MLVVAGSIQIDGKMRGDLQDTAVEIVRELRQQPGCMQMSLSTDVEDPHTLHVFSAWESQAALSATIALTSQLDSVRRQSGKLGVRELSLLKYTVGSRSTLA
jgi:quinol monooxygenase YgiN